MKYKATTSLLALLTLSAGAPQLALASDCDPQNSTPESCVINVPFPDTGASGRDVLISSGTKEVSFRIVNSGSDKGLFRADTQAFAMPTSCELGADVACRYLAQTNDNACAKASLSTDKRSFTSSVIPSTANAKPRIIYQYRTHPENNSSAARGYAVCATLEPSAPDSTQP